MMKDFEADLYKIIAKKLSGTCTEAEIAILQHWLDETAENKATYADVEKLWEDSLHAAGPERSYNTSEAWQKITQRLQPVFSPVKILWWKYAIAASILIFLTATAWWLTSRPATKKFELTATTGAIKSYNLTDSSRVTLRPGAHLRYTNSYHHQRRVVELEGEAFFEITNDPSLPFLIKTCNRSIIEVLGTSFNVQTGKDTTTVIVTSGKVKLGTEGDTSAVILSSGQKGSWKSGQMTSRKNNNPNFIAWKTGILQFNDQSLLEILSQLADFYAKNIKVDISYREIASQQKATITFRNQSLNSVLHELQLLLGFNYKQDGDTIVISQ